MEAAHNVPVKIAGVLVGYATVYEDGKIDITLEANTQFTKDLYSVVSEGYHCLEVSMRPKLDNTVRRVQDFVGVSPHVDPPDLDDFFSRQNNVRNQTQYY